MSFLHGIAVAPIILGALMLTAFPLAIAVYGLATATVDLFGIRRASRRP